MLNIQREKFNVGYIVAGYPNLEYTKQFLAAVDQSQLDVLEIGIPYSDPLADGEVIAAASFEAVQNGVTLDTVFDLLAIIQIETPITFLIYYNLIFSYGEDRFIEKAKTVRLSGVIIPDLPCEEAAGFASRLKENGISMIPLVSITSSKERIQKIVAQGSGFVYAVGALGITGSKRLEEKRLLELRDIIQQVSELPIAIGFGVKTNHDVIRMRQIFDGVIIGTEIVKLSGVKTIDETIDAINQLFD